MEARKQSVAELQLIMDRPDLCQFRHPLQHRDCPEFGRLRLAAPKIQLFVASPAERLCPGAMFPKIADHLILAAAVFAGRGYEREPA